MKEERLVIDGRTLSYALEGQGDPTILLLSGHRTPMANWRAVWPMLTQRARVLAYDRPGTGASDPAGAPQDGARVLATLDALLDRLDLTGPFLVAAHSLGGLYANLLARTAPARVAGLALIEAAHPAQAERDLSPGGPVRQLLRRMTGRGFMDDPVSEYRGVPATVAQIEEAGPFPPLPLRVVTGARKMPFVPASAFEAHGRYQRDLASLAPQGEQIVALESGHLPQLTEPTLVAGVIADLHATLREGGRS